MPEADLIIVNARILTMDEGNPRAEALAVKDGRIAAVGDDASIREMAGPGTEVIDADGNTVLPGFIEAHMHLFGGGAELDRLHLGAVHGFDALKEAVRAYAARRPDDRVLLAVGAGYTTLPADRPAGRHQLDLIIADRPFAMVASDHHTMWANTAALELAGLLNGRTLGPGNEIVMGPDGLATGELREGEAFSPLMELAGWGRVRLGLATGGEPEPEPTPEERAIDRAILELGLEWCARHGITSIQNMDGNLYQLELLAEIEARGRLLCRVKIPFHFKNFMPTGMLAKASLMAERYNSEWLSSGLVKFFMDGVIEGWTAVMVDDYADRPGWRGEPLFTQAQFDAAATEADRRGLQMAVHAVGDGAVRSVLDGYAAARAANGERDSRHRVEHIEVIHPADIPRFAELGAIASMQPVHAPGKFGPPLDPTIARLGSPRWPFMFLWRTLRAAGAHVAFSSDWPVADIDPLLGIQAAILRKPWAKGVADESLTLEEAIAAYTVEGAHAEFAEDRKGRLKAGYFADLVILSDDLEATDRHLVAAVRPVVTVCGGRITYRA